MSLSSNIRVAVQFTQSTVFAGEDVECLLIFTNITHDPYSATQARNGAVHNTRRPNTHRRLSIGLQNQLKNGGRPPVSHIAPVTSSLDPTSTDDPISTRPKHGRSLSIISIGTEPGGDQEQNNRQAQGAPRRSNRGHARATSLQTHSRGPPPGQFSVNPGSTSVGISPLPSPRTGTPSIVLQNVPLPHRSKRSNSLRSDIASSRHSPRKSPSLLKQEFKFPPTSSNGEILSTIPSTEPEPTGELEKFPDAPSTLSPVTKVISGTSINGTPRSSMDLYSMSNHSDETLASEYPTQPIVRQSVRTPQFRRISKLQDVEEQAGPETLMMGYAQVQGSFILDGSLVNQGPFEEVKRRGVLGGQGGGGVVGVERKKRDSGLFGAFGWNNIGESIGGLLGGGELSSIKEMRSMANSRAIPLLTTPQSVLFVNLQLKPGESRKYSFKFTLPKGLPPTHKGRAIKVSYNIIIGVQRPSSNTEQRIRSIHVPFRVFGTVGCKYTCISQ